MGYDTTYSEYHLTPRGWIQGAWAVEKPPTDSSPLPEDRIETWLLKETTHDIHIGKLQREWTQLWKSFELSEEQRRRLRARARDDVVTEPNGTQQFFCIFPHKEAHVAF